MKNITNEAAAVFREFLAVSGLKKGQLLVIGCSSSEMLGTQIGKGSSMEVAEAAFAGIWPLLQEKGIQLAVQCCEHLNRALIMEDSVAKQRGYEPVNVLPQPKAGGSFATVAWKAFEHPVAVEHVRAEAGVDIGNTLIGMHLKEVAVPVRLSVSSIGAAPIVCARTRPKFIGGDRACYQNELK